MAKYRIDRRMREYEECARALNWSFHEKDNYSVIKWLLDFQLFKKGHNRKICPMIMVEHDDLEFTSVFDYTYTISTGNSSRIYRQTVFFRYSKALALPHFLMVPEKWYHRLGNYFGMQDIDFEQYPDFSGSYLIQGRDEEYIRYHFDHPDLIRFFNHQRFYSMEGMNYLLVLYINDIILGAEQIMHLVKFGNTIHNYFTDKTPPVGLPDLTIEE